MDSPQDTIAAIATPLGEGGLGVIRVSGPRAVTIVGGLFQSAKHTDLTQVASHTCHVGMILAHPFPLSSPQTGEVGRSPGEGSRRIDQAVVTVFRAPNSYTGEDVLEISAHGSPFGLEQILQAVLSQGARPAGPGEFTLRAFLSGKLDLTQAEAVAELIRARTDRTQAAALAQLEGSLAREVRRLRDGLLPLIAHVEVGLDHSDEDHDFLNRRHLSDECRRLAGEMASILDSARAGKILREGLRVTLVGRPNVGKSSLLNALLREERAIVTPIPGTTRDTLEERVQWDALPVVLTDTAGLRLETSDDVERLGMARTRAALERSDVVLGLFDGSEPLTDQDHAVIASCAAQPHVWVVTKSDLESRWSPTQLSTLNGGGPVVLISAKTGAGLAILTERVKTLALGQGATHGRAEWLLNTRHQQALERAREALRRAQTAAESDDFEECVALELRASLAALGEIIGETATEDLLGQIFSQFCVGK